MRKIRSFNLDKMLVFFAQGYGPLINFVIFKLLSDLLSVGEMGDYITIYALSFFFTAFIGLGYSFYIFKNLANNNGLIAGTWGKLMFLDLVTVFVSLPIYLILANYWVSPSVSLLTIILIFLTEALIVVLINDISIIFQSLQRFRAFSVLKISFSTMRLLALLPLSTGIFLFEDKLLGYYILSLLLLTIFYIIVLVYTGSKFSYPSLKKSGNFIGLKDGILYSFGNFSKSAYNDVDKIMLANIVGSYEAGLYGVITKIANSIKLPLDSYLLITFPSYFKLSDRSIKHSYTYYLKKLKKYVLFAVLSMGLAFVFVWLLPYLFPKYEEGNILLMVFSFSFLLKAFYLPLADILTSSGAQVTRTKFQILVGMINVSLNVIFIKLYGTYGALCSSMISELILLLLLVREVRKSMISK